MIYRETLISHEPIEANLSVRGRELGLGRRLNLLRACRQIYKEAHDIFWSENKFHYDYPGCWVQGERNLLQRVGHTKASLVRHLTIDIRGRGADAFRELSGSVARNFLTVPHSLSSGVPVVDTRWITIQAHRLLTDGVPASSIRLVEPCTSRPSASFLEQLLDARHRELNREFEETIQGPMEDTRERIVGRPRTRFANIAFRGLQLIITEYCGA